jgi:serine phosphatase RsbU (regulator of sigma subunit)
LQCDDLVLFYTDGLVERRTASVTVRLDQVKRALSAVSGRSGEQALTHLRKMLDQASPDDDTCTLAVRVAP